MSWARISDCYIMYCDMMFPIATRVNTKVVKRIEMLNRYGLGVIILLMLGAGLLAINRLVP